MKSNNPDPTRWKLEAAVDFREIIRMQPDRLHTQAVGEADADRLLLDLATS